MISGISEALTDSWWVSLWSCGIAVVNTFDGVVVDFCWLGWLVRTRWILNDFRFFDGGLEVSKEGIVVKLYFHALCFNDIVFLYCVVHFGHSRRLFALIVCSILLFKFLM